MTAVGQKEGAVVSKILGGSRPSLNEAVVDELTPARASKIKSVVCEDQLLLKDP